MRPSRLPRRSPEKTFESLYRRHFREIFGYTLALLHSPADAEDATQATFLNAYRALARGERPRHAASWLRAIALNVCREHVRRASRRPDEVSLEEDPGELVAEAPGPAIADVIRALSHLPFNQRAALVMREFEGRSVTEIAGLLEVTSSAVETLLFRARRALREQLDGSLRCDEAERAISRQLDGALPRSERGALRAHLRECPACASLARRLRGQRSALKSLALVPVPATLAWSKLALSGAASEASPAAGASLVTAGAAPVAVKVVVPTVLATLAVGAGYATLGHHGWRASARGVGGDAAPGATAGASSASGAGGTDAAQSALKRSTLEHPRGSSRLATRRTDGVRAATARTRAHGASANAGIAGSRRGGPRQTPNGPQAGNGTSNPGQGHANAYGHSGGTGHGGAATATSKPHPPTRPPPGQAERPTNRRGHGVAYGHVAVKVRGRARPATSTPRSSTGPRAAVKKPGNGNAKP